MPTFTLPRPSSFSLAAATRFYAGFTPGAGMAAAATDHLTLAFRLDGSYAAVAARLAEADEQIIVDFAGTHDEAAVRTQLARMLGLDADAAAWRALGRRVPLVGRLQAEFPGFFTAAKASPYDAATWGVLVARTSMQAASRLKIAIAERHGDAVQLADRAHAVFPSPQQLGRLRAFPGLTDEKLRRLHAVAEAAQAGLLDAERLRAMSPDEALPLLQTIRGIGPWTAGHIYYRGAAPIDGLPLSEPRVLHGYAHAAGRPAPTPDQFAVAAEAWRPFRMWVCILCSRHLAAAGLWNTVPRTERAAV